MNESRKPWEHAKASGSESDPLAIAFVSSLSYDTRLYRHDIQGSIAHAKMLHDVGLIDQSDLESIESGLEGILAEIEAANVDGWSGWKQDLEDVHMCIEAALIERIGEPGRKLHTGRSRNDQVALDVLLWIHEACDALAERFDALFRSFVTLAQRDGDAVMPSYTHLQRAQPIVIGGELMGWLDAFDMAHQRIEMIRQLHQANPLGSGAVAGSFLHLDREKTSDALNLGTPVRNSIHATASRDALVDMIYGLSMTAQWLSRWAEQWIIYCSAEFGFLQLDDAHTTGSSMMPQKRNPDMLELIRGRCARVYGHLMAMLTLLKGLTVGYNRDLQEDKLHLFEVYDCVDESLAMATRIVHGAQFNVDHIAQHMNEGFIEATAIAEYLVKKGVPFRTAHQQVGALVQKCIDSNLQSIGELDLQAIQKIAPKAEADITEWLDPSQIVNRYASSGNAGRSGFHAQLDHWRQTLAMNDNAPNASHAPEMSGKPAGSLFGEAEASDDSPATGTVDANLMIELYQQVGRTLDDLPYTEDFENLYQQFQNRREVHAELTRRDVLHRLMNLRKAGKLPRLGSSPEKPPKLDPEEEQTLQELAIEHFGALSHRDQWPYTQRFETLVEQFNATTGRQCTPYQVWRLIARFAK